MMGRREEADSSLRKDIFASILDTFVAKTPGQPNADAEAQVLNLELPGVQLPRVAGSPAPPCSSCTSSGNWPSRAGALRQPPPRRRRAPTRTPSSRSGLLWRLERVAEEVKERQLAAIAGTSGTGGARTNSTSTVWAPTRGRSARRRCGSSPVRCVAAPPCASATGQLTNRRKRSQHRVHYGFNAPVAGIRRADPAGSRLKRPVHQTLAAVGEETEKGRSSHAFPSALRQAPLERLAAEQKR